MSRLLPLLQQWQETNSTKIHIEKRIMNLGTIVTILIAVTGWIIEYLRAKKQETRLRSESEELRRQVVALEKQTAIQESDFDKPPFSEASNPKDSLFLISNTSSRSVYIDNVTYEGREGIIIPREQYPLTLQPGETVRFVLLYSGNLIFHWKWADQPQDQLHHVSRYCQKR